MKRETMAAVVLGILASIAGTASAQFGGVVPIDDSKSTIITNLAVIEEPGGIDVTFTSPLTYKPTTYDLKMSPTTLTASGYDSDPAPVIATFAHIGNTGSDQEAHVVISLPPGTVHFMIRAYDGALSYGYSNEALLTVAPDTTPPATVSNLHVVSAGDQVTLAWDAPLDDAVGIELFVSTTNSPPTWMPISAFPGGTWGPMVPTQHAVGSSAGLLPDQDYYFAAKSKDASDNISIAYSASAGPAHIDPPAAGSPDGGTSSSRGCGFHASGATPLVLAGAILGIALLRRR